MYTISAKIYLIFFIVLFSNLNSGYIFAQYELVDAFSGLDFEIPVDFQCPDDGTDRIFIVEKPGRILVINRSAGTLTAKVFLDITDSVYITNWEMGLLGLAFHPEYKENGYFFVNYTAEGITSRVSRFEVSTNPDSADIESEEIILDFDQPTEIHNGGQLCFGPDNYLYISTGDGGWAGDPQNNAQNLSVVLGKILRIDVDNKDQGLNYAIPPDNPFINITTARDEIYAYGFRNPWRFSFDSYGRIWCGDVGQSDWEEIDLIHKGGNYGWKIMEGNHCYPMGTSCDTTGLIMPIYEYEHPGMGRSVTGGFYYEGELLPELAGKYIFSDFISREIWALYYDSTNSGNTNIQLIADAPDNISSFGIDRNKELYLCGYSGKIYKLDRSSRITDEDIINDFTLLQNYPNPFNSNTIIRYHIPEESRINIEIFNSLGEIVTTFVNEIKQSGFYYETWNAVNFSSGVYYVRMKAESLVSEKSYYQTIKILYLK